MTLEERIDFEIKHRFYYIEYPNGIGENLWKDRAGKLNFIDEMGLDHLKASILLIEKNIRDFKEAYKRDVNDPSLMELLLPLAQSKLEELKKIFHQKVDL
jgi:hypothetical protein